MRRSCPKNPDDTAEALHLGRLTQADADAFREHMRGCPVCRALYERNVELIEAMRAAVQEVSAAKTQ